MASKGGLVPTAVVGPVIKRLIYPVGMLRDLYDDPSLLDTENRVRPVAERARVDESYLFKLITNPRHPQIEFDFVDRVLTALNCQHLWWTELRELYWSVDLSWDRCLHPFCDRYFEPGHAKQGRTRKKYCSKACKTSHHKLLAGETRTRRKDYFRPDRCRNGHMKTPENTKTRPNGRTECRVCSRESARRWYRKAVSV